jgi:hypothetical protein
MLHRADAESNDTVGAEIMAEQIERILSAESEDAVWDADTGGTIQGRDVAGLELRIRDMRIIRSNRSDIVGGHGYYASMNATVLGGPRDILTKNMLRVGQDFVFQTGAPLVVAKVRVFESREALPVDALLVGIETASDNVVLKLDRIPERAVQSETV